MIRLSPRAQRRSARLRPARLRPLALALLTATALTGCEFTQSLIRGRSAIPEAPLNPHLGGGPIVKPPSIVAAPPPGVVFPPAGSVSIPPPILAAAPLGAEMLVTPGGRHIAVLPIQGAPQDRGYVIREALTSAMGLRVDQAAFAAAPQSYRLECRAFLEGGALLLEWRLMDSIGQTLDQAFERQAFTAQPGLDPWSALSDEALVAIGRRSAERLSRNLAGGAVAAAPLVRPAAPAVHVGPSLAAGPFAQGPAPIAAPVQIQPQVRAPAPAPAPGGFSLGSVGQSGYVAPAPAPATRPPTTLAPPSAPPTPISAAPPPRPAAPPIPIPIPAAPAPAPAPVAAPAPASGGFGASTNTASVAAAAPIAFRGVFGAPGDGDRSLSAALRNLLTQSGERIVPEGTPGAMVLAGQVEKKPGSGGDVISITWRLEDAFGGGVGQVLQENEVPRGALDAAWGEDAGYAAEGALDGVQQLISAARKGPG